MAVSAYLKVAKFKGWCKYTACVSPRIHVGDSIMSVHDIGVQGKGRAYHPQCWEKHKLQNSEVERNDLVQPANPYDVETPESEGLEAPEASPMPMVQMPITTVPQGDAQTAISMLAEVLTGPMKAKLDAVGDIDAKIKKAVSDIANESVSESKIIELIQTHAVKRIEVSAFEMPTVEVGVQHEKFETLVKLLAVPGINVWIMGPAGTGKTTACEHAAKALNMKFYFTGALAEPYALLGYKDANGVYQRTPFRECYEHGGLFLYDEIDGSEPGAVLPFNAALANGHCAFPDGIIAKHPNCRIVAAANTWGLGGTHEYVGRLKQDAAVLDRFVKLEWPIDEKLESTLAANPDWVKRVRVVRKAVQTKGIKVLVTPRASITGARLLASGMSQNDVETLVLRSGMTVEQWQALGV